MEFNPKEKLSDHFTLGECCKSVYAIRNGIINEPNELEYYSLKRVCLEILDPVRKEFNRPFTPNSGFRCALLNSALGSSSASQHTKGQAVDFEIPGLDNLEVATWVKSNLIFDQLILENYDGVDPNSGWIHVSFVNARDNRKESLTFSEGNYRVWS
mgnify:CR=1 FL=1|jgi:uncharacterized protein YcbK (DUF882 family)